MTLRKISAYFADLNHSNDFFLCFVSPQLNVFLLTGYILWTPGRKELKVSVKKWLKNSNFELFFKLTNITPLFFLRHFTFTSSYSLNMSENLPFKMINKMLINSVNNCFPSEFLRLFVKSSDILIKQQILPKNIELKMFNFYNFSFNILEKAFFFSLHKIPCFTIKTMMWYC